MRVPVSERFWTKVRKETEERVPGLGPCWIWTGDTSKAGYGRITERAGDGSGEAVYYAHRVAWELENGPLPGGAHVLHKCDNPPCVRNDGENGHLFTGDQRANNADRDTKGRVASGDRSGWALHPERIPRGEQIGTAILTERQVTQIRRAYASGAFTQTELARLYGIKQATVSNIVTGKRWRHLETVRHP